MSVFLETERLTLRHFVPEDLEHLVELDSDPEVMRFLSGGRATPRTLIESEILPRFMGYDVPTKGCGHWAADEKQTGEFIGWFGLQARDPDALELGFRLRRAAWGKGYATEAARALIRWAFDVVGVARVAAVTYQDNIASQRVLDKLGLRVVRRFRMTDDELTAVGTYDTSSGEAWTGDDLEYAIEKGQYERS